MTSTNSISSQTVTRQTLSSQELTSQKLISEITSFIRHTEGNYISQADAIYPELAGLKLYEDPLVGFADADDELFTTTFKQEGVIHPDFRSPREWLPEARTVISFFVPFSYRPTALSNWCATAAENVR